MKVYGLIGYPLGHSFSKQYFTEKFEKEGMVDCIFEAFPIETIDLFPQLLDANKNLKGLSVTIPYKEQVLKYVTEFSEEVAFIGATNSIKIVQDKLIAYNTDIIGFETSFAALLKSGHTKALILGTGGASKAVQFVLKKMGISFFIVSRTKSASDLSVITYSDLTKNLLEEYSVVINCTPSGMHPREDTCPDIPYQFITGKHYLFDLVYKPEKTLFLQKGEASGAVVKNGYDMLIIQAEASWKIWNSD